MPTPVADQTVAEMVAATPSLASIFEQFGIDFCCGGKVPLETACRQAGADPAAVRAALQAAHTATPPEADWTRASLEALVLNILNSHHAYLRNELPRLAKAVEKIAMVHGEHHPELREIAGIFASLSAELSSHMVKEEQILFPAIIQLERSQTTAGPQPWLINPIHVMEHEHAAVGEMLAALKRLSANYTPPADGCNTYRFAFDGLKRLEADLHLHIHKENNILFPRADALERALMPR